MEIIIQPTPEAATAIAARLVARLIRKNPTAVLGLATGGTMEPLYRELVAQQLDWSRLTTFNLDEYVGITPEHPQSYHHFMREKLFRHVNVSAANVNIPDGLAKDIPGRVRKLRTKNLLRLAALICNCSASGRTDTSVSTSRPRPWPRGRASKP